ncbi:MAG: hypothetical protein PHW02_04690, partial [bacterium]|nr:hypothetical protein [bacterium]
MLKKVIIVALILSILTTTLLAGPLFSVSKQNGGLIPCLLGVFDGRLGYMANEKAVNVDMIDVLKVVLSAIGLPVMPLYTAYVGYQKGKSFEGCCIGFQGYTTANMMDKTKGRQIEWFMSPAL